MRKYFNGPYRHTFRQCEMDYFGMMGMRILLNMVNTWVPKNGHMVVIYLHGNFQNGCPTTTLWNASC